MVVENVGEQDAEIIIRKGCKQLTINGLMNASILKVSISSSRCCKRYSPILRHLSNKPIEASFGSWIMDFSDSVSSDWNLTMECGELPFMVSMLRPERNVRFKHNKSKDNASGKLHDLCFR